MEDLLVELIEERKRLQRQVKLIKRELKSLPLFYFGDEWTKWYLLEKDVNQQLYSINQQIRFIKESNSNYGRSSRKKRTLQVTVIK